MHKCSSAGDCEYANDLKLNDYSIGVFSKFVGGISEVETSADGLKWGRMENLSATDACGPQLWHAVLLTTFTKKRCHIKWSTHAPLGRHSLVTTNSEQQITNATENLSFRRIWRKLRVWALAIIIDKQTGQRI